MKILKAIAESIRDVDRITPIIIEPTYWAQMVSAPELILLQDWPKNLHPLVASVHFYLPNLLTSRQKNQNRYGFPGDVPIYDHPYSETQFWCPDLIQQYVRTFAEVKYVRMFVRRHDRNSIILVSNHIVINN